MAEEKKQSFFSKLGKWFKDYKSEFKKIVWPSQADTFKMTAVVLVSVIVVSLVIFLLDTGFSSGIVALGNLI